MTLLLAYIDPGSGSLIIQAVIAAVIAIPIFLRSQMGQAVRTLRHSDDQADARGRPCRRHLIVRILERSTSSPAPMDATPHRSAIRALSCSGATASRTARSRRRSGPSGMHSRRARSSVASSTSGG